MDHDILILCFLLAVSGLVSGLIAGLLGVGGGIILVPVLFQLFIFLGSDAAVQMHMAVATSLAIICFTSVQSWRAHARRGAVDFVILRHWAPAILVGAGLGALGARFISADGLKAIFMLLTLILSARIFMVSGADATPKQAEAKQSPISLAIQRLLVFLIGFFSALMGIGGGTLSVPLLTYSGRSVHQAVATSAGLGFFIAVPATLGFIIGGWHVSPLPPFTLGYVHVLAFAVMIPTTMIGAPLGVKLAHFLAPKTLRYIFGFFLLASGTRMLLAIIL